VDINQGRNLILIQLIVSLFIMCIFFTWLRRETLFNVRLGFEENARLENLRIYGTTEPPVA
jgi:hypothetical protein